METGYKVEETALYSFEESCRKYPDKVALIYLGKAFSYQRLKEMADRSPQPSVNWGKGNDRVFFTFQIACSGLLPILWY
jgi:non-ribosomal peptide synthetase component E (peptide arylation enzyme)